MDALKLSHKRSIAAKPAISRSEAKLIRAALANVAGAMKGKPEPDDFWHDLTRTDAELRNVQLDAPVLRCRQALDAARQQGVGIQAATIRRVETYFRTLCAIAVHGYECSPAEDFGSAVVGLTKESADVAVAAAHVLHEPSERNVEALRVEAIEALEYDETIIDMASAKLAERCHAKPQLAYR